MTSTVPHIPRKVKKFLQHVLGVDRRGRGLRNQHPLTLRKLRKYQLIAGTKAYARYYTIRRDYLKRLLTRRIKGRLGYAQ